MTTTLRPSVPQRVPRPRPDHLFSARSISRKLAGLVLFLSLGILVLLSLGTLLGWWRLIPVYTGSMMPAIPAGSAVIATSQSTTELRPRQIIVFHSPQGGELLVHRVVDVTGDPTAPTLVTKGDANTKVDPWKAALQPGPVWKVRRVIPLLGAFIQLARNSFAQMFVALFAAIGLVVALIPGVKPPTLISDVSKEFHP